MLTAAEIRNVKFSKAMGGYKQEEVDVLLDRIEADYAQFERAIKEYKAKTDAMNKEMESLRSSQNSIQNVLLNAQKLADQMVDEAKQKSAEIINNAQSNIEIITAREKELATAFDIKANERKQKLEKELADMVKTAQIKADSIKAASEDSVARQQLLYDKVKMEMSAFKAAVSAKYKEHLEMLKSLPDTAPMDPKHMAEVIAASVDKAPAAESFIEDAEVKNNVKKSRARSLPHPKRKTALRLPRKSPQSRKRNKRLIMYIAAAFCGIAVLAIDQFTKYYVSSHFVIGETRKFLNGFIDLTYIHNEGAAWGMLSGKTYALLAITLAVMVICVIIFIKYGKKAALCSGL